MLLTFSAPTAALHLSCPSCCKTLIGVRDTSLGKDQAYEDSLCHAVASKPLSPHPAADLLRRKKERLLADALLRQQLFALTRQTQQ